MKLSDIKGSKSLDLMADVMELADSLSENKHLTALLSEIKGADEGDAWKVICKHVPPILRDEGNKAKIVSILATVAGVEPKKYAEEGDVLGDLLSLLTDDSEALGFFANASGMSD